MLAKKLPINNKKTGMAHSGLLPTFISAVCFLLIQFGVIPAEKLNGQAVSAIVVVVGAIAMWWTNWRTPK